MTHSIRSAAIKMDRNYRREILSNISSMPHFNFQNAEFYIRIFISIDLLRIVNQRPAGVGASRSSLRLVLI
jgi:hypothetical protein